MLVVAFGLFGFVVNLPLSLPRQISRRLILNILGLTKKVIPLQLIEIARLTLPTLPPATLAPPLTILNIPALHFLKLVFLRMLFQIHVSRRLKLTLISLARGISFLIRSYPRLQSAGTGALARTNAACKCGVQDLLRHPLRTNNRRRLRRSIRPCPRQRTQRRRKVMSFALSRGRNGTWRLELYFCTCLFWVCLVEGAGDGAGHWAFFEDNGVRF